MSSVTQILQYFFFCERIIADTVVELDKNVIIGGRNITDLRFAVDKAVQAKEGRLKVPTKPAQGLRQRLVLRGAN